MSAWVYLRGNHPTQVSTQVQLASTLRLLGGPLGLGLTPGYKLDWSYVNNSAGLFGTDWAIFAIWFQMATVRDMYINSPGGENMPRCLYAPDIICSDRWTVFRDKAQGQISELIIHQIVSLSRDCSKHFTFLNCSSVKLLTVLEKTVKCGNQF